MKYKIPLTEKVKSAIPETVTEVKADAFSSCDSLTSIKVRIIKQKLLQKEKAPRVGAFSFWK